MKIRHVSFSSHGGAGKVAQALASKQRDLGLDSELISATTSNLRDSPLEHPTLTFAAAVDNYLIRQPNNESLVSLVRDRSSVLPPRNLEGTDVIHLHWMSGVYTLNQISELSKQSTTVWTLHDSAIFTGGCHLPLGCKKFTTDCSRCPQVRPPFQRLVEGSLSYKKRTIAGTRGIRFVTPSSWLFKEAKSSAVLNAQRIALIRNPIDDLYFDSGARLTTQDREALSCLIVANDLLDPNKQVTDTVAAFIEANLAAGGAKLILVGRNGSSLHAPDKNVYWQGPKSKEELVDMYRDADVLAVLSRSENAPLVIAEAAAVGTPSLVFSEARGAVDAIIEGQSGLVINSFREFAWLIANATDTKDRVTRMRLRSNEISFERHNLASVNSAYMKLYES